MTSMTVLSFKVLIARLMLVDWRAMTQEHVAVKGVVISCIWCELSTPEDISSQIYLRSQAESGR